MKALRITSSLRFVKITSGSRSISTVQKEVEKFNQKLPVEKALTPPSSWFTDPDFHTLDKRAIFGNDWICVGLKEKVEKAGNFFTGILSDNPYIVVRDGDTLRAFYNVCRHHAAQVTPIGSEGCTNKFECPYHGWTYGTDGKLTRAMRLKGIQDFSAKNFGLVPIDVSTWGPFVFINLDSEAAETASEVAAKFKPIEDAIKSETGPFEIGLKFVKRVVYNMECNWKVFVDNYLDGGYHVSYLHKDLTAGLDINSYTTDVKDEFSMQKVNAANPRNPGNSAYASAKDRLGSSAVYAYLFPNMMINRYGPWMDTNLVLPLGPKKSQVIYDYFLEETKWDEFGDDDSARNRYINDCLKASDQVQLEDSDICAAVQIGLQSSGYDVGRYAPKVEMADHKFHLRLAEKYSAFLRNKSV